MMMARKRALTKEYHSSVCSTGACTSNFNSPGIRLENSERGIPFASSSSSSAGVYNKKNNNNHGKFDGKKLYRNNVASFRSFRWDLNTVVVTMVIIIRTFSLKLRQLRRKIFIIVPFVILLMLIVPKVMFDAVRYSLMNRPAFIYGVSTDWTIVEPCLSTAYHQEVRDFLVANQTTMVLNTDMEWNWYRYASDDPEVTNTTTFNPVMTKNALFSSSIPRRRLLIAQYSGRGSYQALLREVEPINKAYAKKWGHDYTTLVGTALQFPGFRYDHDNSDHNENAIIMKRNDTESHNDITPSSRKNFCHQRYQAQSTFNKIPLLFKALEESPQKYDQVLILDADTMIVNFDYDISSLLFTSRSDTNDTKKNNNSNDHSSSSNSNSNDEDTRDGNSSRASSTIKANKLFYFLVAYRVSSLDSFDTWDVNAGITLWNLRHPMTRIIAEDWLRLSLAHPVDVLMKNDDQYFLQRSLQKVSAENYRREGSLYKLGTLKFIWEWCLRYSFLPVILNQYHQFGRKGGTGPLYPTVNVGIRAIREEFEYYDATVVKHFKRGTSSWTLTDLDQRIKEIKKAKADTCRRWPNDCTNGSVATIITT